MLKNAVSPAVFLLAHAVFRFGPRQETRMRVQHPDLARRPHNESPIWQLVGHLVATTLVFVVFVLLVWVASWTFSFVHSIHPFPDDVFRLLVRLEIILIYVDAVTSGAVLLYGVGSYVLKVVKGES
jgi:hypothetical protein